MYHDDRNLIEAFRTGDEFAFVSLYNRYKEPVYAFCLKMLLSQDAAKDAMQDTFLRVYENRNRLLNSSSFRAWLFTIARNQCLNLMRREHRKVGLPEHDSGRPELRAPEVSTAALEKSEQVAMVNHYLAQLKPDYREIIILREYQNLSYEEIAAITKTTLSAVKSRLFKARRKLATHMEAAMRERTPAPATKTVSA
ncbi:MAG: RNA polymerase sigma factor [Rhodothermales bacterium]